MAKKQQTPEWLNGGPIDDDEEQGPGAVVDKGTFARIFGITLYQVGEYINRGMPVKRRGTQRTPWQIEVGTASQWLLEDSIRAMDDDNDIARYREAKRAKMQAEWERLKRENDEKRRQLVTIDEAVTAIRESNDIVRKHVYAMPAAVTKALAGLSPEERRDPACVESVLNDCLQDAFAAICADNTGDEDHADAA